MSERHADLPRWRGSWINRLVARPGFQSWASRFPLTRARARRDGAEIFDIVQGFVQSQVLFAIVELQILERLRGGRLTAADLGRVTDIPDDRMGVLLQAAAALGVLKRSRDGRYGLARKGAALLGVPGLRAMIRHHAAFYRDLEDPVALLRGPDSTELSHFWPYVFGAYGNAPPDVVETYSDLMSSSQALVAEDTLRQVSFAGTRRLLDVGGGTGAFLRAVGRAAPKVQLELFDLPQVVAQAAPLFEASGQAQRCTIHAGSFRDDPLPQGADTLSLVRVLYDHADDTVLALLRKVFDVLPPGGRLIISEPMSGGATPEKSGDVYFAFYTMAMQTGRARSADTIAGFCSDVGFEAIRSPRPHRPYVTRVLTAVRPG